MSSATVLHRDRNLHVGARVCIYRNDGSNRGYEAICTDLELESIGLRTSAVFAVGEVVEIAFAGCRHEREIRVRARVLYRMACRYGFGVLTESAGNTQTTSAAGRDDSRIKTARKLLSDLKAAYQALPAVHRAAVRKALTQRALASEAAA
jgi:hypothetical protein